MPTYTMTAGSVITKARIMLNDTRADMGYRTEDADMLRHLNDGLAVVCNIKPGLFVSQATHTTAAGYVQIIDQPRAVAISEVLGVPYADRGLLSQFKPDWVTATPGAAQNWMRVEAEPLRFDLYPPASGGTNLTIRFVQAPAPLDDLTDTIPLSENYEPLLVEFVAARVEMGNDESVNNNRAATLNDRFVAQIKGMA